MILVGSEIVEEWKKGNIHILPFNEDNVGPNSYDVTLGDTLKCYIGTVLDSKIDNQVEEIKIPERGYCLDPNILYLGHTNEEAGSDYFLPMYEGRSSMARLGIQSHLSAGFGDLGFKQQWTLEIKVAMPVIVYPNMRIGQVYFNRVNYKASDRLYQGKYAEQSGVQASQSWKDF